MMSLNIFLVYWFDTFISHDLLFLFISDPGSLHKRNASLGTVYTSCFLALGAGNAINVLVCLHDRHLKVDRRTSKINKCQYVDSQTLTHSLSQNKAHKTRHRGNYCVNATSANGIGRTEFWRMDHGQLNKQEHT